MRTAVVSPERMLAGRELAPLEGSEWHEIVRRRSQNERPEKPRSARGSRRA